jgi:truncated hemoglobin YjbI
LETAGRREEITAEIVARAGIGEPMVERLVRGFYAKVGEDALLAPIFEVRRQAPARFKPIFRPAGKNQNRRF